MKAFKCNASTAREEALCIQQQNNSEQMDMLRTHHGGKKDDTKDDTKDNTQVTVPQFSTGVTCMSGQCGNHLSKKGNLNFITGQNT